MEEIKNREYFKKLANDLMFDLSDEEADSLSKEFQDLEDQMALLDKVNTDGVEEMIYPFEAPTVFLREDEVTNVISQQDAVKNVTKQIEGHFVLPKGGEVMIKEMVNDRAGMQDRVNKALEQAKKDHEVLNHVITFVDPTEAMENVVENGEMRGVPICYQG